MPKNRSGDLAGTIRRSPAKAQRTYAKTLESAHEEYDSEEQAHRSAMALLKRSFEKVGDHWEPEAHQGPSDERSRRGGLDRGGETAGGVDVVGHTRDERYRRAKELGVGGRSKMTKLELAPAIAGEQD
jgi:hypothetical protein